MQLPNVQSHRYNLQQLYLWYKDGSLVIPTFQRDFVWNNVQVKKWASMIVDGISPLGVIVLYSIKGSQTFFLNDGRQRMEATLRAIDNPKKYGINLTSEEMFKLTQHIQMDCQFIEVENSNQAFSLFRMLNQGTTVSARDYYKGILTETSSGQKIDQSIHEIVHRHSIRVISPTSLRGKDPKWQRNNLVLFYVYISGYDGYTYWEHTKGSIHRGKNKREIEELLAEEIVDFTLEKTEQCISNFEQWVSENTAYIEQTIGVVLGHKRTITHGLYRWFLLLSLHRKNNGIPVSWMDSVVRVVLSRCNNGSTTILLDSPTPSGSMYIGLNLASLDDVFRICEIDNIEIPQRINRPALVTGYNNSHLAPFALYGEGETIPENGVLNKSRGAKPIS